MPSLIKRFRVPLIVAGAVIVAAIVLYAALISPQGNKLSSLHAQETQLQGQQAQLEAEIATLRRDKANLASNCANLAKAINEVPGKPSVDSFLQQVTALAVGSGDPNTPTIAVTQAPPAGAAAGAGTGAGAGVATPGASAITVALTLSGTYGQMTSFIKGLDSFPRLFTITTINVSGGPIATGGGAINPATPSYTISLAGTIYYSAAAAQVTICNAPTSSTTTTTTPGP
jgi:Tfp pilus assembly protein PilO